MSARKAGKTAAKTAVVLKGDPAPARIPQPHGGALLPGGVPGNKGGTGRPRDKVRLAALKGAARAVPRLEDILTRPDARPSEVIGASRVLLEFGLGRQLEIEDRTPPARPMTTAETVRRMVEVLPALLRNGLLGRPELLVFRAAIDEALRIQALLEP